MRIHPITLALRYLNGRKNIRGAPFYGRPMFESDTEAIAVLKDYTGQDFGDDAKAWGKWLRHNRWVYHPPRHKYG
jgi:hypothetical protein